MARRPMDDNTRRRLSELRKFRKELKRLGVEPLPYSGWSKNITFPTSGDSGVASEGAEYVEPQQYGEPPESPEEELSEEEKEKLRLEQLCADKAEECTQLLEEAQMPKIVAKAEPGQSGQAPDASTRVAKIQYECFKSFITCADLKKLTKYEEALELSAENLLTRLSDEVGISGDATITFHKNGAVVVYHDIDYKDFYNFVDGPSFGVGVNKILQPKCSSFEYLVSNDSGKKAKRSGSKA